MQFLRQIPRFSFSNYESLITQITAAHSYKSVLDLYSKHQEVFKNEHLILSLRMLGRYSKSITFEDEVDPLIVKLTSKVNEVVDQLNEYGNQLKYVDIVDVLFWLRKFRSFRLQTGIKPETYQLLYSKIGQMVNNQQFSFRNLANLYYDLSILGQPTDVVAQELLNQFKQQTKQITPFTTIQFVSACSHKVQVDVLHNKDLGILEQVLNNLELTLDEYDLDQKSQIFKLIAQVQFQNVAPQYQIPKVVRTLKNQILASIEQMNEDSVIHVFQAYKDLPQKFESDLFTELKDMVVTTLESNPSNLKSKFLFSLLATITDFPRKRFTPPYITKVIDEIADRVERNEISSSQVEKFAKVAIQLPENEKLIKVIQSRISQYATSFQVLEYLFKHKVNLAEQVQAASTNEKLSIRNILRLYFFANRDSPDCSEKLRARINQLIADKPDQVVHNLMELQNFDQKSVLLEEAYNSMIEKIKDKKLDFLKTIPVILSGCQGTKQRQAAITLFEQAEKAQKRSLFNRLFDRYDTFGYDSFLLVLQVVQKDLQEVQFQRLIFFLTNNNVLATSLAKTDLLSRYIHTVSSCYLLQKQKEYVRLNQIVNLIKRFEQLNIKSHLFRPLLSKVKDHYLNIHETKVLKDSQFLNLLINYNQLSIDQALQEWQDPAHESQKAKLASYALLSKQIKQEQIEEIEAMKRNLIALLPNVKVNDKESQRPVYTLAGFEVLSEVDTKSLLASVKQIVKALNPRDYFNLVQLARNETILRELAVHFPLGIAKQPICNILIIIEKFIKANINNSHMFNKFLEVIGEQFLSLPAEQRIRSMQVFTDAKLRQVDFFEKNLEKIASQVSYFRQYISQIFDQVYTLGLTEPAIQQQLNNILSHAQFTEQDAANILKYQIIADFPIETIENTVNHLVGVTETRHAYVIFMAHQILKRQHPKSIATENLEKIITTLSINQKADQYIGASRYRSQYCLDDVQQYLQAIGVQSQQKYDVNGVHVDIYIPEQEIILNIVTQQNYNYDRTTETGQQLLNNKLLNLTGKKIININYRQFHYDNNTQARISYLVGLGITPKQDADLSQIKPDETKESKEAKQ